MQDVVLRVVWRQVDACGVNSAVDSPILYPVHKKIISTTPSSHVLGLFPGTL